MEVVVRPECNDDFDIQGSIAAYASLLKESTRTKSLQAGKRSHMHMITEGLENNLLLANHLVDMYGKCGCILEARHTFDGMSNRNVYSWMPILSAYADHGNVDEVLKLYKLMMGSVVPDKFIFVTVLKSCTSPSLDCGQNIHAQMIRCGTDMDAFVRSALMNMYIKCGLIDDACHTFNETSEPSVVLWNTMISGLVQQGLFEDAGKFFKAMNQEGILPDKVTYVGVLQVCASMGLLNMAREHHTELVNFGYHDDLIVSNALIDMYAKNQSLKDAWAVFASMAERDIVSWNVIIASNVQHGFSEKAFSLFQKMKQDGIKPNETTFVNVLKACTTLGDFERGEKIHEEALKAGCKLNAFLASVLIDLYAKGGRLKDAYEVFCHAEEHNVVVWTAMISGYMQQGFGKEAIGLYERMERNGVKANEATFICVLKACSSFGAVEKGVQIHDQIKISIYKANGLIMNNLMEMYANCGRARDAHVVFDEMLEQDVVSWTTLIGGYAKQGLVIKALSLLELMLQEAVRPNAITFIGILSACSHGGLIDAGCHYFYSMIRDHGIMPTSDHYACIVDLLGRAGHIEEAIEVILNVQDQQSELIWRTLLGACKTFSNEWLAKFVTEQLLKLNPGSDAAYVLLSDKIVMASGIWCLTTEEWMHGVNEVRTQPAII